MNHVFRNQLSNALVAFMPTSGSVLLQQLELRREMKLPPTIEVPRSQEQFRTIPRQPTVAVAARAPGLGQAAMIEQTLQNLALSLGLKALNMNISERAPDSTDLAYLTVQNREETYASEGHVKNQTSFLSKAGASVLIVEHNANEPCPPGLESLVTDKKLGQQSLKSTFVLVNATVGPGQSLADSGLPEAVLQKSLPLPAVTDPSVTDLLAQRRQDQTKASIGTPPEEQTQVQPPTSALTQRR